jgi:hypothetical protein
VGDIQRREEHWAIIDLVGKAGHVRTVPVPAWVKAAIDAWTQSACVVNGKLFRAVRKNGMVLGKRDNSKRNLVRSEGLRHSCGHQSPSTSRFEENVRSFVSRGWRRTGADSVSSRARFYQTTERHLGCKQRIRGAVNDRIGIEPKS